ncbi:MAG: RHS repeat-associated core domain-containing protein [Gammaproteobacteria bacterium]|nr:RHS repeat-associated core domain-containing protein [Gammaproteobacteria bacterium]
MGYALHKEKLRLGQKVADVDLRLEKITVSDCCVKEKRAANDELASGVVLPGQYFDQETNLHYNHHRYYDPELGRYITSDPIGLMAGLNTYSYVEQNPLYYYDPDGLAKKKNKNPPNPNTKNKQDAGKSGTGTKKGDAGRQRNQGHPNAEEHNRDNRGKSGGKSKGGFPFRIPPIFDSIICAENPVLCNPCFPFDCEDMSC